jgi:hypothetical protein
MKHRKWRQTRLTALHPHALTCLRQLDHPYPTIATARARFTLQQRCLRLRLCGRASPPPPPPLLLYI